GRDRRRRHSRSARRQGRARRHRARLVDLGDNRESSEGNRAMTILSHRAPLTLACLALALCVARTSAQEKTYIVTVKPVDVGMPSHGLCVAVDDADPHGVFWWE